MKMGGWKKLFSVFAYFRFNLLEKTPEITLLSNGSF